MFHIWNSRAEYSALWREYSTLNFSSKYCLFIDSVYFYIYEFVFERYCLKLLLSSLKSKRVYSLVDLIRNYFYDDLKVLVVVDIY